MNLAGLLLIHFTLYLVKKRDVQGTTQSILEHDSFIHSFVDLRNNATNT